MASAASRFEVEPLQHLLERDRRRSDAVPGRLATTLSSLAIARAPAPVGAEKLRLGRAWERIGSVARQVPRFEAELAEGQRRIETFLRERQANAASLELIGLGSRCEQIDRSIQEAKSLAAGSDEPRREIVFYEEWHRRTRARLHARIAETAGLGEQVAISGSGISQATHPDLFANTRAIYAVRTKAQSLGAAVRDPDARQAVEKVLGEARAAKAALAALQAKYRKDEAASRFLGDGEQERLIDEPLRKLEEAAAKPPGEPAAPEKGPQDPAGSPRPGAKERVEAGLAAVAKLKEKAVRAGKRVDAGVERVEGVLEKGIRAGGKIDSGLQKLARLAGRVGSALGDDSALGKLATRVGAGIDAGHGKLEGALGVARAGKDALGEGHDLLHRGLEALGGEEPEGKAPREERADPVGELIDAVLGGDAGRVHADRDAARGAVDGADPQEIDGVAADTWMGSGEGTKMFSDVFAPFLPAEGGVLLRRHSRERLDGKPAATDRASGGERKPGFFASLFEDLEGFADRVGGWAKKGERALGKGMHYAELGMHGLSKIEGAARGVHRFAGKAEEFLAGLGLDRLAGAAAKAGSAAGWVDGKAQVLHGAAKKADRALGKGKKAAAEVGHGAEVAEGIFHHAAEASGELVELFRASRGGDGIDGRRAPDKVVPGAVLDEPRRLDVSTLSRMESFLGEDFSSVRVHTGSGAAEVTRRFDAEAVTVRDHIFFAPGRFNPASGEGQQLIAHELTHVLQRGRRNLDVRTAESEALHAERAYGRGPAMETLNLSNPPPDFRLQGEGQGSTAPAGIHTAKRTRSRGSELAGKDALPDGEEFLEEVSGRVYDLLMEELEQAFESR